MEADLKKSFEILITKLDDTVAHAQQIKQEIKELSKDMKSTTAQIAELSKEIGKMQTEMEHAKEHRVAISEELKRVWDHFSKNKEDMKEYVHILFNQENEKNKNYFLRTKNWVLGLIISGAAVLIANLVTLLFFYLKK